MLLRGKKEDLSRRAGPHRYVGTCVFLRRVVVKGLQCKCTGRYKSKNACVRK